MKHILFCFLPCLLSLCLLCGCMSAEQTGVLQTVRRATQFDASDGTLHFTISLTEQGGEFRFSEPEILKELTVTVTESGLHASYNGLESDVPENFLATVLPLYRAIRAFQSEEPKRTNDAYEIKQGESTYRLYQETQDGINTRIDIATNHESRTYTLLSCLTEED